MDGISRIIYQSLSRIFIREGWKGVCGFGVWCVCVWLGRPPPDTHCHHVSFFHSLSPTLLLHPQTLPTSLFLSLSLPSSAKQTPEEDTWNGIHMWVGGVEKGVGAVKPTLLFLHGASFSSATWRELGTLSFFVERGYRCV